VSRIACSKRADQTAPPNFHSQSDMRRTVGEEQQAKNGSTDRLPALLFAPLPPLFTPVCGTDSNCDCYLSLSPSHPPHRLNDVSSFDHGSLAYSWDRGRIHYVVLNFYPEYESAKIGLSSAMKWLGEDLGEAAGKNQSTVLFIHSVQDFSTEFERVVAEAGNVKAV